MCTLVKDLAQSFSSNEAQGCFVICNNKKTSLYTQTIIRDRSCKRLLQQFCKQVTFDTCTEDNLVPLLIIQFQQRYFYVLRLSLLFFIRFLYLKSCLDFTMNVMTILSLTLCEMRKWILSDCSVLILVTNRNFTLNAVYN